MAGQSVGDWRRKGGLNGGAGIEYFSRRDVTVKVEIVYQYVVHETFEPNPSGLALKIGLKKYLW
ncbi:MAG: hypothetical protein HY654_09325 [Acidobacteria bacterium]|nr:hypothetical protein [Acidobacteriota bacterium]